jgi:ribosomal protein S12 methylthiotransferase
VLVEGVGEIDGQEVDLILPSGHPVTLARSYRDAPEVDGLVLVPGVLLQAGQMATVTISGALAYDLVGELAPEIPTAGLVFQPAAELMLI